MANADRFRLSLLVASLAAAFSQAQPSAVGQWSSVMRWPEPATHAVLLPTGKVLWWTEQEVQNLHLWDPATNAQTAVPTPGFNPFCSGHALLEDGRLFIAGGHIESHVGEPRATLYDPFTNAWIPLPNMNAGRWYPSALTLPSGDALVVAGSTTSSSAANTLPQIWDVKAFAWRNLTGALLELEQYPWLFVAPNGKVFCAGPEKTARYLDTTGGGAWTAVADSSGGEREAGSAVMYAPGKVLIAGGGDPPVASAEVIDLSAPRPAWRQVGAMVKPRKQHNMTVLPDGTVLVTGGSCGVGRNNESCPVLETEIWDPKTERFTVVAPSRVFRGYHSTALLLPDGRVLSGGGVRTGSIEIYSPPYLFKGSRPSVASSPDSVRYGETFTVATPDAARIARVTLIRVGAVTHAFNQSQRFHELQFTAKEGAIDVAAPPSAAICPPGPHLLFLLDANGVPSIGKMVRVGGTPVPIADRVVVVAPNGGEKLRAGGSFEVRWVAQGASGTYTVELSDDGGATWTVLARNVAGHSYVWTVPPVETERARIRVTKDGAPAVTDTSDLPFAVSLGLCAPCGPTEPCAAGFACVEGACHRPCSAGLADCACQSGPIVAVCACPGEVVKEGERCEERGSGAFPICSTGLECHKGRCRKAPKQTVFDTRHLATADRPSAEPAVVAPEEPKLPGPRDNPRGCGMSLVLSTLLLSFVAARRPMR